MKSAHGTRSCPRWLLASVSLFLSPLSARPLPAENVSPHVRNLDTEVTWPGQEYILLRGAFEITGPTHRWYGVYFQLRLDAATPLKEKGKEGFVKLWNNIFTPENVETARYTDCRLDIPVNQIASATGLPRGKRTVLWAVCDVWDTESKKYIGSGWDVRAPLIVTTDEAGKIVKIETFNTSQFSPKKNHYSATINVKECQLHLRHLNLKPGARLYRAVKLRHETHDLLVMGDRQAELTSKNRGFFFKPIDSPEKAAELVEIGYPGAVIIKSAEQYQAIVKALKAKGWLPGEHIKVEKPPSYGVTVTAEPQLGYRVKVLMIHHINYYDLGLRQPMYREFAVASDGRIGIVTEILCIEAPQTPYGAPPGWAQPLPLGPKEYNKALRSVLTAEGSRTIPPVTVTNRKTAIKCAQGEDPGWYLNEYEDWPEHANQ